MADVVDKETRSRMMSGIRGKNTKPEILIRKELFSKGFRYRLHAKNLPGKPDLVFPKYKAVIFIHGCFWHGHNCHLFKWPKTNRGFWENKISGNIKRDRRVKRILKKLDWRIFTVWECAVKGSGRRDINYIAAMLEKWVKYGNRNSSISGTISKSS